MIGRLDPGINLKVSIIKRWEIWTFGNIWQKSYLSLRARAIKKIIVNLSDKVTKNQFHKIILIHVKT